MARQNEFPKRDVLNFLRRNGAPQETVEDIAEHLTDPIDLDRDGQFLLKHGITRDHLISRMGGSP